MRHFNAQELHQRLSRVDPGLYTLPYCQKLAQQLGYVEELKARRRAVLLAHNYQRPEIFEVADFVGDSLGLSLQSGEVQEAEVIIFCGVHFMAEIAKIVNPHRKVILPNLQAGCSLADMADEATLKERIVELKKVYGDDLAVVAYVNTSAAVKALSDACCTSSNAVEIARALPQHNILFLPDKNLGRYVASQVPEKNIILWDGYCYVHQEIEPEHIKQIRDHYPDIKVLVHPECRDDVIRLADATLSTSGMVEYARNSNANLFLAVTECGLSDLLTIQVPHKRFFRACKICRFMKMITLDDVVRSLETLQPEIYLSPDVRLGAERAIMRMFELTHPSRRAAILSSTID